MTEHIFREVHYGYTDGTALGCTLEKQEEIVRCRDCKWFDADVYVLPNDENWVYSCDFWGAVRHVPSPDGFCSYGERRTNDN